MSVTLKKMNAVSMKKNRVDFLNVLWSSSGDSVYSLQPDYLHNVKKMNRIIWQNRNKEN